MIQSEGALMLIYSPTEGGGGGKGGGKGGGGGVVGYQPDLGF